MHMKECISGNELLISLVMKKHRLNTLYRTTTCHHVERFQLGTSNCLVVGLSQSVRNNTHTLGIKLLVQRFQATGESRSGVA